MSIGNELTWMIIGLFVLVAVIILGIVFKPDFLQNAPLKVSPAVHHAVVDAHSNLAKSSLNLDGVDSSKGDMQERINKEEGEYGHLSHPGKTLQSVPYTVDALDKNIYQHISSDPITAGAGTKVNRLQTGKKLLHYNYDGVSAMAAHAPADSDKSGSLGSDSKFSAPYSQNRSPFTKAHGHIHDKKWADDAVKGVHAAGGAAPSVIEEKGGK